MIDIKTRTKLENLKGMCIVDKKHKMQYVKENKKGLITMSCVDCFKKNKFKYIITLNINKDKKKTNGGKLHEKNK